MCWIGFKEQKKIAEKDIICNLGITQDKFYYTVIYKDYNEL